jgi:hypothetical protein
MNFSSIGTHAYVFISLFSQSFSIQSLAQYHQALNTGRAVFVLLLLRSVDTALFYQGNYSVIASLINEFGYQ